MGRMIGIRHRVKRTKDGEARPTLVAIVEGEETKQYELSDETDELDFVFGQFPVKYREAVEGDELERFVKRQLKERKKKGETEKQIQVPIEFEGLRAGDTVVMSLGGSGDYLALALARQARKIGAQIWRVPPKALKEFRYQAGGDKKDDHELIVKLFRSEPQRFYLVEPRDFPLIELRIALRARQDAQKDRIACEQRLFDRLKGQVFIEAGEAPERTLEDQFLAKKATDKILQALVEEEEKCSRQLERIVVGLPVYRGLFKEVTGFGPMLAARLISAIGDIRRFPSKAKLKRYCGVHVTDEGKFPRRRQGELANWTPDARQSLYLFASDQCNKRPDSVWGQKLREYKTKLRAKHPGVVVGENQKKKYTDGHIHKMAIWRTATKFIEFVWKEWTRLEREAQQPLVTGQNGQAA